jgi:hypothetical protein
MVPLLPWFCHQDIVIPAKAGIQKKSAMKAWTPP